MDLWEYLVEEFETVNTDDFVAKLDELGAQGWEFCVVLGGSKASSSGKILFKRKIVE
jgi:hypothetical protein